MNRFAFLSAGLVVSVVGCADFDGAMGSGGFDPLSSPGQTGGALRTVDAYRPGQFVRAFMDNTAFFLKKPDGSAEADKLLPRGTSMKVVMNLDSYLKVELDSGEIGFVPAIMVEDPNAAPVAGPAEAGGYQVDSALQGFEALPAVPQGERPPEGAVPTVADPQSRAVGTPVPPVDVLPKLPPSTGAAVPPPAEGSVTPEP